MKLIVSGILDDAEEEDEKDDLISAAQFLHILEESIRTFMAFLRADKRSHYQMFRDMVRRRRTNATDQALIIDALKKSNSRVSPPTSKLNISHSLSFMSRCLNETCSCGFRRRAGSRT